MRRVLGILLIVLLAGTHAFSADDCFPKKPSAENKLVYELQGIDILSDQEEALLNNKLSKFARETSNQILVLTVDDLCGYDPAQFAFDIGEQWGIGQGKFDNGVVVLIKPSGGQGNRKTFIAVGYGLEAVIPDLTAKHIVDQELLPNFKQGNMYGGIDEATNVLMSLAIGEFNSGEYAKRSKKMPWAAMIPILLVVFIGFILPLTRIRSYSRTNNVSFWVAMALMSQASRSHGGMYGGGSGFGGGGGGGFGGFGGGGFGGGGAGGSW